MDFDNGNLETLLITDFRKMEKDSIVWNWEKEKYKTKKYLKTIRLEKREHSAQSVQTEPVKFRENWKKCRYLPKLWNWSGIYEDTAANQTSKWKLLNLKPCQWNKQEQKMHKNLLQTKTVCFILTLTKLKTLMSYMIKLHC